MTPEKPLPNNIEAEASVLGAGILKSEVLYEVGEILAEDDFYIDKHRVIYKEMMKLLDQEGAFDLVLLTEHLKKEKLLDRVGGVPYLAGLIDIVPSVQNAQYYAKVVREKAKLRKLCEIFDTSFKRAVEEEDPEDIVSSVEKSMFSLFKDVKKVERIGTFYEEYMEKVKDTAFAGSEDLKTGFRSLDAIISLSPSDLIILAGRPGMGKTQFFLNMILSLVKENIPILFFSIEMGRYQIFERLLSIISGERVSTQNIEKIEEMAGVLLDVPLYIDDTPRAGIMDIRLTARRMKMQNDIKALFIDHFQLITHQGRDRYHQMTEVSGMLKALAKELNIPVIVASQLSRGVEQRINKRPLLSDLRESGAIEQDADRVIFLYREDYYKQNQALQGPLEVIVAKNRNGKTGSTTLIFNKETGRIYG